MIYNTLNIQLNNLLRASFLCQTMPSVLTLVEITNFWHQNCTVVFFKCRLFSSDLDNIN